MTSPATDTTYTYAADGGLIRIEAHTPAGIAGVWHVTMVEALNFAIKQAKEPKR